MKNKYKIPSKIKAKMRDPSRRKGPSYKPQFGRSYRTPLKTKVT